MRIQDGEQGGYLVEETNAPTGTKYSMWWVVVAVGVGSLLSSIDTGIVNISLPTVRHYFHTDVATSEWVVTIYLLVVCGLLLTVGRLGDMYGQKRVYVAGFATFVVGSALCGVAPSVWGLVGFRALQAIGASMVLASAPAILTQCFPATLRGRVLGLQVMMVYIGSMTGPSLGGYLTDHFTWRSVFYINVPIGILALGLCSYFIPNERRQPKNERFDYCGAGLFMVTFSLLLIALNSGHRDGWTSGYILGMFGAALVCLVAFVLWELRQRTPLLDLSLFASTPFSMGVLSAICNYAAMFTATFLMPFYLIQGRGMSSASAGLLLTIQPAIMMVFAPTCGALSDKIGVRPLATTGMILLAAAMLLYARADSLASMHYLALCVALTGMGLGLFTAPNNSSIMGAAPRNRQGIASGVVATARYIGMILGVGVSGAIFTTYVALRTTAGFYRGIHVAFAVACAMSLLGAVASAVRGKA